MKYIIKGSFTNGDKFTDTARNKKELYFILHRINENGACNKSIKILNNKGEDITEKKVFEWLQNK